MRPRLAEIPRTALLRIALLAIALWPQAAAAQPVFYEVRDWTLHVGEGRFGLLEVSQLPGGFKTTQIWFGQRTLLTRLPAAAVAGIAGLCLFAGLLMLACAVRWRAGASRRARRSAD